MPCLSGRYDPAIGPIINIGVLRAGSIATLAQGAGRVTTFPALIDTGASHTCISSGIVTALALEASGMRDVVSATHATPMKTYLVDLMIPFGAAGYGVADVTVTQFANPPGSPFQALLGRDILCRGMFTMTFDGHYTFSL